MVRNKFFTLLCAALLLVGSAAGARVKPGLEVLCESGFKILEGKRVALLTNPSGVDSQMRSAIDILYDAPNVNLVRLFGPEHGVRGNAYAGNEVYDSVDESTGLPVYSLYGAHRSPSDEMLRDLDVVVYDIQDVGVRSYTFISSLGLMMRECGRMGIEVVVLDRPNPLGGLKIEGNYPEPGFFSYVGQYRIPYVYGMTVGELARMINEEGLNCGQKGDLPPVKCKLTVVPMEGWTRDMLFTDTGLPWVLPSPNIPYPQTAIDYPSAGLCGELYNFLNIGIGYTLPFQVFAAEWVNADDLKALLDSYQIPGVAFRTIHYTPFFGMKKGVLLHGVQYFYTDYEAAQITLTQFYVMQAIHELYPDVNPFSDERMAMFDKVCGSSYVRDSFSRYFTVASFRAYWDKDIPDFRQAREKYLLY
ncbi:MAG: DUF1343 domain-containing protein [Bacteroidales bacterium]|nr:DUF1343 domain-containing protein [Bacteroidales bacterium]